MYMKVIWTTNNYILANVRGGIGAHARRFVMGAFFKKQIKGSKKHIEAKFCVVVGYMTWKMRWNTLAS